MTRPQHRRPPTVRLLLVALLIAATLSWTGAPAQGQSADASPALRLVQQSSWVGPDGVFQVSFSGGAIPAGATAGAVLYPRLRTRSALDAVLDGQTPTGTPFFVRQRPVSELASPDGTITVSLPVSIGPAATPDGVQLSNAGVYPYVVQVTDADGGIIAELATTMLRLEDPTRTVANRRLAVGVVVPVQTETALAVDGAPVLDDEGAEDLTATIAAVAARPDVPLTVSPSPEAIELLAGRDADGADTVAELGTNVARQLLTNPYAAIDTGAWVQAGLGSEMTQQWLAGYAATRGLLGIDPDPSTAVVDPTVTSAALAQLVRMRVETVVVPSDQVDPLASATANAGFAEQFDIEAGDAGLLRAVGAADPPAARLVAGDDPGLAGHNALAELALLHGLQTSDGQGVAVAVPAETDPRALATFLAGLAERDGTASGTPGTEMLSPVTLDGLFSATAVAETTRSGGSDVLVRGYRADPPGELGAYPSALRTTNDTLGGLRSLLPEDSSIVAPVAVSTLSSGDRSLDADERITVLDSADRSMAATVGEIVVAPEQVVTLTSSSGKVPLNLENRLQESASVRIVMSSAKLDFPEGAVIERVLDPQQTTTIDLPVETRASGAFPLTVTVTSADGALPVATTKYTVRSTAISGVGLVLSIGAGLFLLVWWARHFRTARRARKLVASNHPALSGTEPDGYAPPDSDPMEGR